MLDLVEILDKNTADLARNLAELPDPRTLLRRLRSILEGDTVSEPWFPVVPMERFLRGTAVIEEYMLARMGWEVEPDPVVRAKARSRLRRGLARLARQYAAAMDRENATLRSRLEATRRRLLDQQGLTATLLAHVPAAVFLLDASGHILDASAATLEITGLPPQHARGSVVIDMLPGLAPHLRDCFQGTEPRADSIEVRQGRCPHTPPGGDIDGDLAFRLVHLSGPLDAAGPAWILFCSLTETRGVPHDRI